MLAEVFSQIPHITDDESLNFILSDFSVCSLLGNGIHRDSPLGESLMESLPMCSIELDDEPPSMELKERRGRW